MDLGQLKPRAAKHTQQAGPTQLPILYTTQTYVRDGLEGLGDVGLVRYENIIRPATSLLFNLFTFIKC